MGPQQFASNNGIVMSNDEGGPPNEDVLRKSGGPVSLIECILISPISLICSRFVFFLLCTAVEGEAGFLEAA